MLVRTPHDCGFGHRCVGYERGFYFHGAQTMAGDVDYIVDPAHDPKVAVFVFAGPIAGEIHAGNLRPVLLHVAIRIAIDGAQACPAKAASAPEIRRSLRERACRPW